jgi:hypothetical protein
MATKFARRELPELSSELEVILMKICKMSRLDSETQAMVDYVESLVKALAHLDIGISLSLNQLLYELDEVCNYFRNEIEQLNRMNCMKALITDFLYSPRYQLI